MTDGVIHSTRYYRKYINGAKKKCKCNLFTHGAPRSSKELIQKWPCIPESNWNLKMLVFEERGKPEYPKKNLSEQSREPTTNSTHIINYDVGSGSPPGTHWWEASALTTALTLPSTSCPLIAEECLFEKLLAYQILVFVSFVARRDHFFV